MQHSDPLRCQVIRPESAVAHTRLRVLSFREAIFQKQQMAALKCSRVMCCTWSLSTCQPSLTYRCYQVFPVGSLSPGRVTFMGKKEKLKERIQLETGWSREIWFGKRTEYRGKDYASAEGFVGERKRGKVNKSNRFSRKLCLREMKKTWMKASQMHV